jgi:hypothetical protein
VTPGVLKYCRRPGVTVITSGVGLVVSVPLGALIVIHWHGAGQSAGDVPGDATAV